LFRNGGTVNADGEVVVDKVSTQQWIKFIKENKLSHYSWSITNKNEGAAILKPTNTSLAPWQDDELTTN
jgi:endoglucanase